jgi:hypothetical protein
MKQNKKLKRRQEMKEKQEDQDQEPSQEDESDKTHDLGFIHTTSQTKPKNLLKLFFAKCLTLLNNLENPHQSLEVLDLAILSIHIKSTPCPNLLSNYH